MQPVFMVPKVKLWREGLFALINSEAARLFIFPTSVLGSSFVTVFAGCCVFYISPEMSSFVCTVTRYLWKQ